MEKFGFVFSGLTVLTYKYLQWKLMKVRFPIRLSANSRNNYSLISVNRHSNGFISNFKEKSFGVESIKRNSIKYWINLFLYSFSNFIWQCVKIASFKDVINLFLVFYLNLLNFIQRNELPFYAGTLQNGLNCFTI